MGQSEDKRDFVTNAVFTRGVLKVTECEWDPAEHGMFNKPALFVALSVDSCREEVKSKLRLVLDPNTYPLTYS